MTNKYGTFIFSAISIDADQKDADPGIADVEDANERLARLKGQ